MSEKGFNGFRLNVLVSCYEAIGNSFVVIIIVMLVLKNVWL